MFTIQSDESVVLEIEGNRNESSVTPLLPRLTPSCDEGSVDTTRHHHHILNEGNTDSTSVERQRELDVTTSASLAWAKTTPWLATLMIPMLIIFNHAFFYYGQTAPMWRLHLSQQVDVWANATSQQAKVAFYSVGLDDDQHFVRNKEKDVRTFTYGFAIQELWRAKALHGRFLPRLTSVLLVLFSGIWPHLKLLLLNITWLMPYRLQRMKRRTRILHWLSVLGKWSLADVLAVCVLLAVLDLTWIVDPINIKHSLIQELPNVLDIVHKIYTPTDLCTKLLHYGCEHPSKFSHITKCKTCTSLFDEAFGHPSWAQTTGKYILDGVETSGGGMVQLSVVGMRGIYAFCGAVILSICLSVAVDVFDNRARWAHSARQQQQQQQRQRLLAPHESDTSFTRGVDPVDARDGGLDDAATLRPNHYSSIVQDQREVGIMHVHSHRGHTNYCSIGRRFILPLLTAVVVALAVIIPTMERKANGAIPTLLYKLLRLDWERLFSFRTLVQTVGAARGWDLLLMGTFNLFIVVGPIVRVTLCVVGLICPVPQVLRKPLYAAIDFLGAFCAWEVFSIAVLMVQMQMPVITETIIHNSMCVYIAPDGKCLQVQFNMLKTFVLVVLGGFLLIPTSGVAIKEGNTGSQPSWSRGEDVPLLEHDDLQLSITDREEGGIISDSTGINLTHLL